MKQNLSLHVGRFSGFLCSFFLKIATCRPRNDLSLIVLHISCLAGGHAPAFASEIQRAYLIVKALHQLRCLGGSFYLQRSKRSYLKSSSASRQLYALQETGCVV